MSETLLLPREQRIRAVKASMREVDAIQIWDKEVDPSGYPRTELLFVLPQSWQNGIILYQFSVHENVTYDETRMIFLPNDAAKDLYRIMGDHFQRSPLHQRNHVEAEVHQLTSDLISAWTQNDYSKAIEILGAFRERFLDKFSEDFRSLYEEESRTNALEDLQSDPMGYGVGFSEAKDQTVADFVPRGFSGRDTFIKDTYGKIFGGTKKIKEIEGEKIYRIEGEVKITLI